MIDHQAERIWTLQGKMVAICMVGSKESFKMSIVQSKLQAFNHVIKYICYDMNRRSEDIMLRL